MRKLVWMTAVLLLISTVAVAAIECDDLDEQPDIEDTLDSKAIVEYGIEDKADTCVSGKDGYTKDPSTWVREYYCEEAPAGGEGAGTVMQRKYKDFDCTRYGYEKCEGGKCVGGAKASTNTSSVKKPTTTQPNCGDHKVQADRGEQCDPPDDICYVGSDIGICTRPASGGFGGCQCKLYKGGSETATPETATETTATTTTTVKPATAEPEEPEEEAAPEPEKSPTAEEREPLPTEYEPPAGISVTRGISNGIKSFFHWIGSWFD